MPITVNSPYSGRPVKVRDADIERAVRDEEGRVFYVVKRPSGEGYYAALTRKGSAKDEARYDGMETKMDTAREVGAERSAAQVHDATGRRRPGTVRRAVILFVIVLLLAAAAWFVLGRFAPGLLGPATPTPAIQPAARDPAAWEHERQCHAKAAKSAKEDQGLLPFITFHHAEALFEKSNKNCGSDLCAPLRLCVTPALDATPAAKLAA